MSSTSIKVVKKVEYPRPVKSTTVAPLLRHVNFSADSAQITGDELIIIAEGVAAALAAGSNDAYLQHQMSWLCKHLKVHGPRIEIIYKDTLDRLFVAFRNASQDEDTHLIIRVHLLELIELRAKNWISSDGANMYYKHKSNSSHSLEPEHVNTDALLLSSSPPLNVVVAAAPILGPGEVIKTSGKYLRPTKIPGKNYSKDEVVIRNADSGKVTPGAKERLVQITGPTEEKINHAKQLIEDTIRRNASPVRLDRAGSLDGSIDSLNSLEESPRHALHHSFSTNDATVGEYNYTVNVGNEVIKIAGKNLDYVFAAKQELDRFFASKYFESTKENYFPVTPSHPLRKESLDKSDDSEDTYKNPVSNGGATAPTPPVTPREPVEMFMFKQVDNVADLTSKSNLNNNLPRNNSLSALNIRVPENQNTEVSPNSTQNGLVRSRRNHFSRKSISDKDIDVGLTNSRQNYTYETLLHFSSSPYCTMPPKDWITMNKEFTPIIRKVDDENVTDNVTENKNNALSSTNRFDNKPAYNKSQFATFNKQPIGNNPNYDRNRVPHNNNFDNRRSFDGARKIYGIYDNSVRNINNNYFERKPPTYKNDGRRASLNDIERKPYIKNFNNVDKKPFTNSNTNDVNNSRLQYRRPQLNFSLGPAG